jgi:hypothetical protein
MDRQPIVGDMLKMKLADIEETVTITEIGNHQKRTIVVFNDATYMHLEDLQEAIEKKICSFVKQERL